MHSPGYRPTGSMLAYRVGRRIGDLRAAPLGQMITTIAEPSRHRRSTTGHQIGQYRTRCKKYSG
jgi:hypothetical protein